MLPIAMIVGAIFYKYVESVSFLTPYLIFSMLLITYCKLSLRNMNISPLHFWLLSIQIFGSLLVYYFLLPLDSMIAEGTFICIFAPTATAAAVITGMLGGDIACLATYSLLSNMTVALTSPIIFSFMEAHGTMPFWESFLVICKQMIPLLILPFIAAIFLRKFFPKAHNALQNRQSISFYMWAISLSIVMGKTVSFIINQGSGNIKEEILLNRRRSRIGAKKYSACHLDGTYLSASFSFHRTSILCRVAKQYQLMATLEKTKTTIIN